MLPHMGSRSHTHTHTYTHTCTHTHIHAHMRAHMRAHTHTQTPTHARTLTRTGQLHRRCRRCATAPTQTTGSAGRSGRTAWASPTSPSKSRMSAATPSLREPTDRYYYVPLDPSFGGGCGSPHGTSAPGLGTPCGAHTRAGTAVCGCRPTLVGRSRSNHFERPFPAAVRRGAVIRGRRPRRHSDIRHLR